MFHSSHIHMPNRHRQRTALRTFFPSSSFSPPDSKEPLRRGILFSSVASVLLLVGAILTWLGFNDVFGGKISMTGPLLIALALLMLLLSFRQFMLARKRNRTTNGTVPMEAMNASGVTAVVVDHDDGNGAATIVVETWDSEENNNPYNEPIRNTDELAPPAYTDIAQSYSSNCPSFISHEDHNEAPPTYEETCGETFRYDSESSLNGGSRRCSSQLDTAPNSRRTSQQGQIFFQSECAFSRNSQGSCGTTPSRRSSNTLCPSSAALSIQAQRHQATTSGVEPIQSAPGSIAKTQTTQGTNSHPAPTEVWGDAGPDGGSDKPPQWSRRSFSSIPSYTCLLSESGEVSAQVFDTSSIIEEMMPSLNSQGKDGDLAPMNLLSGSSIIPTRSHSMSSVNTIRQGVPYNINATQNSNPSNQAKAILPNQPIHDQQPVSAVMSPGFANCSNNSSQIPKSPSFTHRVPTFSQGSDTNLGELLTSGPSPLHAQSAESNSNSSLGPFRNENYAQSEGQRRSPSPQLEVTLDRRESGKSNFTSGSQESGLSQVRLHNTQDIQETI